MNKILVIDDIYDNLALVKQILEKTKSELYLAQTAEAGIQYCNERLFDLLLIDVRMPGMNGFEAYNQIKNNSLNKTTPAIFFVARTDIENIPLAFQNGGVDIILKPFMEEELKSRVKTHIKIHQQRLELSELAASKDKFFSIISHDLKSPFQALIGLSDLLIDKKIKQTPEKKEKILYASNLAIKQTYSLLENILMWASAQSGFIKIMKEKVNICKQVKNVIKLVQLPINQKQILIENNIPTNINVCADKNILNTILRNLITNAIKFTPENGKINVNIHSIGDFAEISVSDTGIGMDDKTVENLFRLDKTKSLPGTDQEKGTGIGLIICKEFVELQGGNIRAISQVGIGSTFFFTIPLYQS